MRRIFLPLVVFSLVLLTQQARAGFEWLPPSKNPAPTYEAPKAPPASIDAPNAMSGGMPAATVTSEPLGIGAPTAITPPSRPMKNLSGALFIDPYPLRTQANNVNKPVELSSASVEQAMIEQANILNPLPLGAGMKTGAQPIPAVIPYARAGKDSGYVPRAPAGGLTPMTDGEPLPLPGFRKEGPKSATPIVQYAEAIGFGRDLPLALALSQIIPDDFSHSYADGVDAGTIISWEGGAPWNQILENMLKPKGLTASIQGKKVTIQPLARL